MTKKHEKVFVLVAPLSKLKNSTTVVHHFLSRIDLDRSQELKYGFKIMFLFNFPVKQKSENHSRFLPNPTKLCIVKVTVVPISCSPHAASLGTLAGASFPDACRAALEIRLIHSYGKDWLAHMQDFLIFF